MRVGNLARFLSLPALREQGKAQGCAQEQARLQQQTSAADLMIVLLKHGNASF
jgi:hypothetical protein